MQSKSMFTPADCARCIDETLGALELSAVHLVGHSYGGWLAAHTAAHAPDRLETVTMVDPANTVARTSARFWRSFAHVAMRPRSVRSAHAAKWMTGFPTPGSPVDRLTGLFVAGFAAFAPPVRTPPPLFPGDRLLRSIHIPVQVLLAGNTIHDSSKGLQRIGSAVPTWHHHLWPDASHALPAEVPDEVNASIREFAMNHRSV